MLASIEVRKWNDFPTGLGSAVARRDLEADFDAQVRQVSQEQAAPALRPTQVRNFLVTTPLSGDAQGYPPLERPLRVTVEEFDEDGVIAFLASNKAFSGVGDDLSEAVGSLMESILHDHHFYESTPDDALTTDALEQKAKLRELFAKPH